MLPNCFPPSLGSILFSAQQQIWFEDFQDGHYVGHLGYWNKKIFSNSESPRPIDASHLVSAQYGLRFRKRFCSLISKQNNFSNSEMPCCPNVSHQVWAQSDLAFRSRFLDFQDCCFGHHLGYWNARISAILTLHVAQMPPTMFHLNLI